MMRTVRERLASERGSVGVLVALVVFLVLGMLTMTWNTAELSKAKMRLQNAADSAALAHAIWQARGMNAVQNINDEMHEGLRLALALRTIGEASETAGKVIDGWAALGGPFAPVFEALAKIAHIVGVLTACTGAWLGQTICARFLVFIQKVYAKTSTLMGYYNAQLFAGRNEADPLFMFDLRKFKWLEKFAEDYPTVGIYALGFAYPFRDTIFLPLEESGKDAVKEAPWKVEDSVLLAESEEPWKAAYDFFEAKKGWEVKPLVSKRGDTEGIEVTKEKKDGEEKPTVKERGVLPGPSVWIAFKAGKNIHTLPIDGFWNPKNSEQFGHKAWMFAIASAQCITGDVVMESKRKEDDESNQRPSGFGTGATAKLVPVSTVFYKMGENSETGKKAAGTFVDAIIYH